MMYRSGEDLHFGTPPLMHRLVIEQKLFRTHYVYKIRGLMANDRHNKRDSRVSVLNLPGPNPMGR